MIITKSEPFTREEIEKLKRDQKIIIESLAMDLKRVALGLHRGSLTMANRFRQEAFKREQEIASQKVSGYLKNLLVAMNKALSKEGDRAAEDALMYSTLFQNYALKKLHQ